MKEFLPNQEIFGDKNAFSIIELLSGLETVSEILNDTEDYIKSLPLLSLIEHISVDIVKSHFFMVKARVLKCIALASLGYIHESIQYFLLIIHNKDKIVNGKKYRIYIL